MSESLTPTIVKQNLRVDLSAKEVHDYSIQLANENKKVVSIEEEKKSIMSQYKAKIDESKARINKLSAIVTDAFEMRDIECEIEYNKPEHGKKTIIRRDINKVHAIEKMDDHEHNLFTQVDDDDTSDLLNAELEKLSGNGKSGRKSRRKF